MSYSLMIAPFDFANHNKIAAQQFFDNYAFFELTPKRAKEYFLWYKNEIPNRIAMLWEYMKEERPESQPFDYSPESLIPAGNEPSGCDSIHLANAARVTYPAALQRYKLDAPLLAAGLLIPLWDWYKTKIKQVPKTKKEIEYSVSKYPKWMEENIRKITMKYTDETLSLALDISIYYGETIIKNYPNMYWGHFTRPKREFFANKPVILKLYCRPPGFTLMLLGKYLAGGLQSGCTANSTGVQYK